MFEKKVVVETDSTKADGVPAAEAVQALASALGYKFKKHGSTPMWGPYIRAVNPNKPESIKAAGANKAGEPHTRYYSAEDGVRAIAEALGLEFRAEYVVGKSEPQLKAIKKAKVK